MLELRQREYQDMELENLSEVSGRNGANWRKRILDINLLTPEDDAGGTDSEECSILDDTPFTTLDFHIIDEGAGIAVVVAKGVAEVATLVAADVDGAVVQVNAGVNGLERRIDGVALLVTANDVVAHMKRNDLFVVENILNNNDAAARGFIHCSLAIVCVQLGILVFLCVLQLRHTDADAELLATLVTLEYQ